MDLSYHCVIIAPPATGKSLTINSIIKAVAEAETAIRGNEKWGNFTAYVSTGTPQGLCKMLNENGGTLTMLSDEYATGIGALLAGDDTRAWMLSMMTGHGLRSALVNREMDACPQLTFSSCAGVQPRVYQGLLSAVKDACDGVTSRLWPIVQVTIDAEARQVHGQTECKIVQITCERMHVNAYCGRHTTASHTCRPS